MSSPEELSWYASQSAVTTPGKLSARLDGLPRSAAELHRIAHGLVDVARLSS